MLSAARRVGPNVALTRGQALNAARTAPERNKTELGGRRPSTALHAAVAHLRRLANAGWEWARKASDAPRHRDADRGTARHRTEPAVRQRSTGYTRAPIGQYVRQRLLPENGRRPAGTPACPTACLRARWLC